jgi:hypothetical protein
MQVNVQEALIKTVSVGIQTLTVNNKQLTLSIFRQLHQEDVIDRYTGQLKGGAWGTVNYFWNDCGWQGYREHRHVVWQKGKELRWACVEIMPNYGEMEDLLRRRTIEPVSHVLAYRTVKDGWTPSPVPSAGSIFEFRWAEKVVLWCAGPTSLFNVWKYGAEARPTWPKDAPTYLEALVADVFPAGVDPYDYDQAVADINADVEEYCEAKGRYLKSIRELNALDQLFIAA